MRQSVNQRYKPHVPQPLAVPTDGRLPIDRPIAIYYRQSTDAQVGNVSTAIQTVDMVDYLKRLGWADDQIIMIDMDEGVSGTTKIDERPGMRMLFDLITEGEVGTVACQDEDRLFRDVTQIQVNIFIEACRASAVFVLTPTMVYDFANEMTGTFHARQFRFKSEMAAEYINTIIKGKLHRAKTRLMLEGRWAGPGIPPGYMIDMRRTLSDGSKNPDWRRYVPFEPYAEVVREYFRLFLANNGQLRATVRHINEHGPYYPDPEKCRPPEGFKVLYRIHNYGQGYCPGRTGLYLLLTNAAYLGHWTFKDAVIRWHNHPAIVETDVFYQAFNYLSEVTLRGKPNPDYRPVQENARPTAEENRSVERPLLSGLLESDDTGKLAKVGTHWVGPMNHYTYVLWAQHPKDRYVWGRKAESVDKAVVALLHRKLSATFDAEDWEKTLKTAVEESRKTQKRVQAQLSNLETVMDNLIISLETLDNGEMVRRVQERYEQAKAEHARLSAELEAISDNEQRLASIRKLKDNIGGTLENWDNMNRDQKRRVVRAFIDRVQVTAIAKAALRLTINWQDGSEEEVIVRSNATHTPHWLPSETERLLELFDGGASQIEIAREFPDRPWRAIGNKLYRLRGTTAAPSGAKPIKYRETFHDYIERVGEDGLADLSSESYPERAPLYAPG